jgi:hypothetical protein
MTLVVPQQYLVLGAGTVPQTRRGPGLPRPVRPTTPGYRWSSVRPKLFNLKGENRPDKWDAHAYHGDPFDTIIRYYARDGS